LQSVLEASEIKSVYKGVGLNNCHLSQDSADTASFDVMQIIGNLNGEKSSLKEELERINEQLQKQTVAEEGSCCGYVVTNWNIFA